MLGYDGVVKSGGVKGVRFEIITPEEFEKRYKRYEGLWKFGKCIDVGADYSIDAVLLWEAWEKRREIVIEDQKRDGCQPDLNCRYIMWWLGYCIVGKCSVRKKEEPEWLYDDITYALHCHFEFFGLVPMRWELRDSGDNVEKHIIRR
ncbi:MAG: hypothetical protein EJNHJLOP_00040 [Methanophagales virus PBV082]|uniref:Uncharacterized protein n=1 Tax=Methanophagales virus PBV082 TaxID=3071307 RepID=A0AA46TDQ5_9VIRU|nr:MAG: hypothetical protein QIT52_gp40 [Methanophagales virus PBV082]UYL64929.1 MAG: hypothetical protein EJNHJLOP_00040 [Methanophagales virus PBV082]